MKILSNSFNSCDTLSFQSIKDLGERYINDALVRKAMKINSYSEDILCTLHTDIEYILFGRRKFQFFIDVYLCFNDDDQYDLKEYTLTLLAFLAILPQEDIDELISSFK